MKDFETVEVDDDLLIKFENPLHFSCELGGGAETTGKVTINVEPEGLVPEYESLTRAIEAINEGTLESISIDVLKKVVNTLEPRYAKVVVEGKTAKHGKATITREWRNESSY